MATVVIHKRKNKRGISYRVLFKDPTTFKSKHYKTCRKYKDAQSEAGKLRELLDNGGLPKKREKKLRFMRFSEVGEVQLKIWKQKLSEGELSQVTYDGYAGRIDNINKDLGSRLVSDITTAEIKSYRIRQYEEQSAATSNRNLFIIKQVTKLAEKIKASLIDPTKDIKYLSEKEHERNTFLEPNGIERLIVSSRSTRAKFYMPALIYLGAEHGAAKQEALNLRWKDINFDFQETGLIRFFRTKNTHERTEFLMPRTKEALLSWKCHLEWIRKRKRITPVQDEYVFCRLNGIPIKRFDKAWRNVRTKAGMDDFHFHDLRHTFCSNLILSGSDLKEVKDMIGHRDLSTTDRYSHLTSVHKKQNQERLAAHYFG